jgi:exonuclease SbcD
MARFCFVHVADLHLDTPFACTRVDSPQMAEILREATFQAWERVVSICIESSAGFLVVAGDIFDASQKSLRAQLRFRDGLERLNHHSIPVFVTHGNHDPLDSVSASLPPPPNTYVFGPEVESREVRRDGQLLALLTGVSHPQKNESRNLARMFSQVSDQQNPRPFRLALLHCNVGAETGHDAYAPCELTDLTSAGYDYWALGHVHERRILSRSPWIVYPGNTQGRSLRELGSRGCVLVEVEGAEVVGEPRFVETDAVRWFSVDVDAEPFANTHELLEGLLRECLRFQQAADGRPAVGRLVVRGRTHLYRELRRPGYIADLENEVRATTAAWNPFVDLAVLNLVVRPPLDLDSLGTAPDFLGDLLRGANLDQEQCLRALEPLLEDARLNKLKLRTVLEEIDWQDAVLQAKYLCADLLSAGDSE